MKKFFLIVILTGAISFALVILGSVFAPPLDPDFTFPSDFTPPETGEIIKPLEGVTLTAFEHFTLKRFLGYPLGGWLYPIAIVRFVLTSVWFLLAVYFLLQYLRGFYGPRMIPLSWLLIVAGLLITNIAEIGENFSFHEWPYHGILEVSFLLVLPHFWGALLVAGGTWLLLREVVRQRP